MARAILCTLEEHQAQPRACPASVEVSSPSTSSCSIPHAIASLISHLLAGKCELVSIRVFEHRHRPPYLFLRLSSKLHTSRLQRIRCSENVVAAKSHWLKASNSVLVPFGRK